MRTTTALTLTALLLAGTTACTSSSDDAKPAPTKTATPTSAPATPTTEATPTPSTPEEKLDAFADEEGLELDWSLYDSASEYVQDMCDSLPEQAKTGSAAQWLAENQRPTEDEETALRAGVPELCPKWEKTVLSALRGDYVKEKSFSAGTYPVGEGEGKIPAGTYQTTDSVEDCYWERTTRGGDIIDNQFATAAQRITVTIRASDGSFTTRGCGTWKPAK